MAQGTSIGSLFFSTGVDFSGFKRDAKQGRSAMSGLFNPAIIGSAALGAAMIKLGSDALKFSKEFETAFAEVQTISQSARENAEEMSAAILKMTTEIPVGAIDSTRALYQIVSAGFDGADAMSVLEISAKAAVAGVTTTAIAADTLTTIINAYGMAADNAASVSDALFKTVELGKTTLAEIGSSFSQVASIAAAYGVDVNEALAATAAMTKQGAPTAQAMTAIKAAIVSVTEKLGENIFQTHSFGDALQLARNEADKSGQGLQSYFGRLEAVNGVLMLTNQNAHVYASSLDQINKSAGSADKAFAIMNKTLASQEKLLSSNIALLQKQFGDVLSGIAKDILPRLNSELKILGDDTIPGYAKALSVLANIASLGFGSFTAEQFSPDIVKSILKAERAVEDFTKKTKSLSNEAFVNEVNNIKEQRDANLKSFEDLEDRKKKGFQFDANALEEAKDRNLIFYQILEKAEERLSKIKEKSGTKPKDGAEAVVVPVKITIGSIKKEIKDLNTELEIASKKDAIEIEVKVRAKEKELVDFVTGINDRIRSINDKEDGGFTTGLAVGNLEAGVELSKKQTKEFKKQGKELAKMNGQWVKSAKLAELIRIDKLTRSFFEIADIVDQIGATFDGLGEGFAADVVASLANVSAAIGQIRDSESGLGKASGILGIVQGIGNIVTKAFDEVEGAALSAQASKNKGLADQLTFEEKINQLYFERLNLQNDSVFLGADFTKTMANAAAQLSDETSAFDETMSALLDNAIFTSKGTGKRRLFGKKTVTASFTLKDILGGIAPEAFGAGLFDTLIGNNLIKGFKDFNAKNIFKTFLDPLSLFGGSAKSKAQLDAFNNITDTFTDAMDAMGMSVEDLSTASSQDLLDLFSLVEDAGKITDEGTLSMLANAKAQVAVMEQAQEAMKGVIEELAGSLGNQLGDALVAGFEEGTDAALKFKDSVTQVLEDIIKQQLLNALFRDDFDKLEARMKASFSLAGDQDLTDDLIAFYKEIEGKTEQANEFLKQAQEFGKENDFDLFTPDAKQTGASGAISAAMTEDTATELQGIWNRSLFETISHTAILNDSNGYLSAIADNTLRSADTLDELNSKIAIDSSERDTGNLI